MSSFSASAANRRGSIVPPLTGVDGPDNEQVPDKCDVLICGTGLTESILSAGLAWQGSNVIHVDGNSYYGDTSAVLNPEQVRRWVDRVNNSEEPTYSKAMLYMPRPLDHKKYLIDLSPRLMFAKSDLLELLIKCRVSNYLEFKALGSFHTFENDTFEKVAGSKEDIFTDQSLNLGTKRLLMKFMKFVLTWETQQDVWQAYRDQPAEKFLAEVFNIPAAQATELIYSVGLAPSARTVTPIVLSRIKRYLTSLDVYGTFPALYSMYGSAGEIAQGFCRSAAVAGATYKLSTQLASFDEQAGIALFTDGSKAEVSEKVVISPTNNPYKTGPPNGGPTATEQQHQVTRLITVVQKDCKEWFAEGESAAVVVFPPGTLSTNNKYTVQAIILGSGSGQCPEGQAIWYLSTMEPGSNGRAEVEEAIKRLEQTILRESTEDFEIEGVTASDVTYRDDGMPVLSSVKLGQSMQNFVPTEKLQYLLKLCFTQTIATPEAMRRDDDDGGNTKIIYSERPSAEISYDGMVFQARKLYERIVGSDDDFFDVDFEDDEEEDGGNKIDEDDEIMDDGHHVGDIGDEMEL